MRYHATGMTRTAEVVIIGGGIAGSSIAWHLTQGGCKDVVVLEREAHQGLGSTGKSMGGVRAQFATEPNIRMSLYSIPMFDRFEEITGHPSGYKAHGYLFMATTPAHMDYLRTNHAKQVALGLKDAELLSPSDVAKFFPLMRTDDVIGGSFCATDGFVDPHSVMTGFMLNAAQHGATLMRNTEVTAIDVDSKGVAGVHTKDGAISTRIVVDAAGPWAAGVANMAGIDHPVVPLRRCLVPSETFPDLPEKLPMIIDMSTGWHFRPEAVGILMAWNDRNETPGFKNGIEPGFIETILTHAANRVPAFAELEVNPRRAWSGHYAMSPDHHAILGPVPSVPGFFVANGFSGHGVMHSPATGKIVADLILRGTTDLTDPAELGFERFSKGRLIEETAVL